MNMIKKLFNPLLNKKGFAELVWLLALIPFLLLLVFGIMQIEGYRQKTNSVKEVAQAIVEVAADKGSIKSTSIVNRFNNMLIANNIQEEDVTYRVYCDGNYDAVTGKVQKGEVIYAEVTLKTEVNLLPGLSKNVTKKITRTDRSQEFYKELDE